MIVKTAHQMPARQQADPRRPSRCVRRHGEDGQVDGEQDAATEVAQRPAARGDPVALVRARRCRRRIASYTTRLDAEEERRDHEQHGAELPVGAGDEVHQHRHRAARPREPRHQRGLGRRPVGDRAHDRQHQRREDRRGRDEVEDQRAGRDVEAEDLQRHVAVEVVAGGLPQALTSATEVRYGANSTAADRGDVGRVGPVVPVPGPLLLRPHQRTEVGDALARSTPGRSWSSPPLPALGEHGLEYVGAVGHQTVDTTVDQRAHLVGVVDRPHVHVLARGVGPPDQARRGDGERAAAGAAPGAPAPDARVSRSASRPLGSSRNAATSRGAAEVGTRPPVIRRNSPQAPSGERADEHPVVDLADLDEVGERARPPRRT